MNDACGVVKLSRPVRLSFVNHLRNRPPVTHHLSPSALPTRMAPTCSPTARHIEWCRVPRSLIHIEFKWAEAWGWRGCLCCNHHDCRQAERFRKRPFYIYTAGPESRPSVDHRHPGGSKLTMKTRFVLHIVAAAVDSQTTIVCEDDHAERLSASVSPSSNCLPLPSGSPLV